MQCLPNVHMQKRAGSCFACKQRDAVFALFVGSLDDDVLIIVVNADVVDVLWVWQVAYAPLERAVCVSPRQEGLHTISNPGFNQPLRLRALAWCHHRALRVVRAKQRACQQVNSGKQVQRVIGPSMYSHTQNATLRILPMSESQASARS